MSMDKADDRLTVRQAAALLGVGVSTIHGWVTAGRIRSERMTPPGARVYRLLNKEDVEQVRRERATQDRG